MTESLQPILTVGHSTMPVEELVALLRTHRVTAIADVRSQPHSRMNPQFNREALRKVLLSAQIKYVFLGRELGARATDASLYTEGAVSYERLGASATPSRAIDCGPQRSSLLPDALGVGVDVEATAAH